MKSLLDIFKTTIKNLFIKKTSIDYSRWVFSSSFNTKFNYNSKYLFQYILEYEKSITPIFVINNNKLKSELQTAYGDEYFVDTRTKQGKNEVLKSGVWLTSAGLPLYGMFLNRNRIIVNLWHGIPLKKIVLLEKKINMIRKIYFKYMFSNNYTFILTTSSNLISVMSESFGVNEEKINVLGQPRNDLLFDKKNKNDSLEKIYLHLPKYRKLILYAPTYREYSKTELFPFYDFRSDLFDSFLEEHEIILFIRMHQSEIANSHYLQYSDRIIFINEDKVEDIMEVLNIFDLLITDYSSIYIDFLLLERPIIFLPYDFKNYSEKRGFNFNYDEVTPGPKPKCFDEFKNSIQKLLEDDQFYKKSREKANNFFNEVKKENSKRIIEELKKQSLLIEH